MEYKLWDRKSKINNINASHFLQDKFWSQYNGDIILISENGKVLNMEKKTLLAEAYNIDINLDLDKFMKKYEDATKPVIIEEEEETEDE